MKLIINPLCKKIYMFFLTNLSIVKTMTYKKNEKKLKKNEKKWSTSTKNQSTTGYVCKLLCHNKIQRHF